MAWVRGLTFEHPAQQTVLVDDLHEVEHVAARLARLDAAITDAVTHTPPAQAAPVRALQALRGLATVTAVTVVAEVGDLTRFPNVLDGFVNIRTSPSCPAPAPATARRT